MIQKPVFKLSTGQDDETVTVFDNGVMAKAYLVEHLDVELSSNEAIKSTLETFFENLPEGLRVKFISFSDRYFDDLGTGLYRSGAMTEIGFSRSNLLLVFEKNVNILKTVGSKVSRWLSFKNPLEQVAKDFSSQIDLSELKSLGLKATPKPIDISFEKSFIKQKERCLRIDSSHFGVLKLIRLGNFPVDFEILSYLKNILPDRHDIVFSIERVSEKNAQLLLNSKSKREETGGDLKSQRKFHEAQRALEDIDLSGKKVFNIEFSVVLTATNAIELRSYLSRAQSDFKAMGDFYVEDIGVLPAFIATLPGGKPQVRHLEITDRVSSYCPILQRGNPELGEVQKRSFLFHRDDDSLDSLDLFARHQNNFSAVIIGKSGRGKSVFTNNLVRSLNYDEKLKIILVDVKGSHTNTVKSLEGSVYKISTNDQSAMSPFEFIKLNPSRELVEILSDFVEKLLLEDGEFALLRSEQARLEEIMMEYVFSEPRLPSIDDFFNKMSERIPRSDSLKRWLKNGVYGKVFSPFNGINSNSKVSYFDFTNIVTAQKGGVSSAIMSAIMAHFNYTLLSKKTDETLVFICDETPFFVRNCFSSFNLLMKNVRKLNGSLVLIAQNLSDLVVNGDPSLVSQTECRIFFSRDEFKSKFKETSGLSDESIEILDSLGEVNGQYTRFVIRDNRGEKVGKLRLSREEYFRSTTLASDKDKIEKMGKILGIEEENKVIEILADIGGRYEISV